MEWTKVLQGVMVRPVRLSNSKEIEISCTIEAFEPKCLFRRPRYRRCICISLLQWYGVPTNLHREQCKRRAEERNTITYICHIQQETVVSQSVFLCHVPIHRILMLSRKGSMANTRRTVKCPAHRGL